jgi:hypothetical protein
VFLVAKIAVLESFYASKAWREFRLVIIGERRLICEQCGRAIAKPRDAHVHHKTPLTIDNYKDANIALNPNNVMLVHKDCHDQIHKRFAYAKRGKEVFIVYGMPLSGKTSFVEERKGRQDIVLDMDRLYEAITLLPPYDKPNNLLPVVRGVYNHLLDNIKTRFGRWETAWVIGGFADKYRREKLANDLGAELIFMECTKEEALSRIVLCEDRRHLVKEYTEYIDKWIERYVA